MSEPAQPIDADGFAVAIEQVAHFEATLVADGPDRVTLTFVLANGETLLLLGRKYAHTYVVHLSRRT